MGLQFAIRQGLNGPLLADYSSICRKPRFGTNEHGYADLSMFVPADVDESFWLFDRSGLLHFLVHEDGATTVWEGMIEDVAITDEGLKIVALGFCSALGDTPYTATHTADTGDVIVAAILPSAPLLVQDTLLIESPGVSLDEVYEDKYPLEILDELVMRGDSQTPPRVWEAGVAQDRRLYFRPRGSAGRVFYVDVSAVDIERTLDTLWNAAYAVYKNTAQVVKRTATAIDQNSIDFFGRTRTAFVSADTTSATVAGKVRDTYLNDHQDPPARSSLKFKELYDANGALWPNYEAMNGDTITIRTFPPTLTAAINRLKTFLIRKTDSQPEDAEIEVTPDFSKPTLEELLAGGGSRTSRRLSNLETRVGDGPGTFVPTGMIGLFDAACPEGWTELTAARGRFIVGVPSGGTVAGTKGTALGDLDDVLITTVVAHNHGAGSYAAAAEAAHTHGIGTYVAAGEAAHTHGFGTLVAAGESSHTHPVDPPATNTDTEAAHTHDFKGGAAGGTTVIALTTANAASNVAGLIGGG